MGRQQPLKGNPESKQYYLTSDFTGGINTTAVDERVYDNEFRDLLNVELSNQGRIENRKGFKLAKLFNAWLTDSEIVIPVDTPTTTYDFFFLKVVYNEGNLLKKLEHFETIDVPVGTESPDDYRLTQFQNSINGTQYKLHLLLGYRVNTSTTNTTKFDLIVLEPDRKLIKTIRTFDFPYEFTNRKILKTVDYQQYIYILINQLNATKDGFIIYDIDNETMTVVDETSDDDIYAPNPYDIKNIGFNILAKSPLTFIKNTGIYTQSINGLFLTDVQGRPIGNIPRNGEFHLNVIVTGDIPKSDIIIDIYALNALNEKVSVKNVSKYLDDKSTTSLFVYSVVLESATLNSVFIEVKTDPALKTKTFATTTALTAYYNQYSVNSYVAELFSPTQVKIYKLQSVYNFVTKSYGTSTILFMHGGNISNGSIPYVYPSLTDVPLGSYFFGSSNMKVFLRTGSNSFSPLDTISPGPNSSPYVNSVVELTPFLSDRYYLTTPAAYYIYNGGKTGTNADFSVYTASTSLELSFTDEFTIGDNENVKEVTSLFTNDLSNLKALEIKNRLVIYQGNTIWFSDLFTFNYFPNYNFVNLALAPDDYITSINYFRGSYIIFTKNTIWKMAGEFGADDFRISIINETIGCIAGGSVRSFNNTLAFLTKDGIYRLKQNFYQDGLENVEKIDTHIRGLIPYDETVESLLYNEQYMLLFNDNEDYDTLRYYYNIQSPSGSPFVKDQYAQKPDFLSIVDTDIYTIKKQMNGTSVIPSFFIYDRGYTDFYPPFLVSAENEANYQYTTRIVTSNLSFGFPTHDKKFKNIYIKTISEKLIPLYIKTYINGAVFSDFEDYQVVRQPDGELTYEATVDPTVLLGQQTLVLANTAVLDDFEVGLNILGDEAHQVHKIIVSGKGKNLMLHIEQKTSNYFGIQDIGYLYKLGKVRETR